MTENLSAFVQCVGVKGQPLLTWPATVVTRIVPWVACQERRNTISNCGLARYQRSSDPNEKVFAMDVQDLRRSSRDRRSHLEEAVVLQL